jgi:hypothetical protein
MGSGASSYSKEEKAKLSKRIQQQYDTLAKPQASPNSENKLFEALYE